jgi:hypothetical protein
VDRKAANKVLGSAHKPMNTPWAQEATALSTYYRICLVIMTLAGLGGRLDP